jgi:hypothetical protein
MIIVECLPHEQIWRRWVESAAHTPGYTASLVIHAKNPENIASEWVRERTLDCSFRPKWNSVEVIRAMLAVLAKALEDPCNQRFIFATETCIPIWDMAHTVESLFEEDVSWLNAWNQPQVRG